MFSPQKETNQQRNKHIPEDPQQKYTFFPNKNHVLFSKSTFQVVIPPGVSPGQVGWGAKTHGSYHSENELDSEKMVFFPKVAAFQKKPFRNMFFSLGKAGGSSFLAF